MFFSTFLPYSRYCRPLGVHLVRYRLSNTPSCTFDLFSRGYRFIAAVANQLRTALH